MRQELGPGPGLDWPVLSLDPEPNPDEVPHGQDWLPDQPCNGDVVEEGPSLGRVLGWTEAQEQQVVDEVGVLGHFWASGLQRLRSCGLLMSLYLIFLSFDLNLHFEFI